VPSSDLPNDIRRLILDQIPSIERLEILLLLSEDRARPWTIEEIEERIRSTPESIRQNVSALIQSALVTTESTAGAAVRFHGRASSSDDLIAELAQLYRTRRVAVIETIYGERNEDARSFSDAFKIRKTP